MGSWAASMSFRGASHTCQCCTSTCGLVVCIPAGPRLHPWGCTSPTHGKQIAQGAGLPKLSCMHGLKECFTHMPVLPQHLWLVGLPSFWPQAAMAASMELQVPNPWQADCTRCRSSPSCAGCMGLRSASHTCQCCPSTCGLLVCQVSGPRLPWLHPWSCKSPTLGKQIAQGAGLPQAVQAAWA